MTNSSIIKNSGSMIPAYVLVVSTLLLLPWRMMGSALPILALLFVSLVLLTITKAKGVSFLVMAIGVCLPVVIGMDDSTSVFFQSHFNWLIRTIYACSLSLLFLYLFTTKRVSKKLFPAQALVIISILVLLNAFRFGETVHWLFKVLTVPVMFYIGYKGKESWDEVFRLFTVIFFGIVIYAILDMFFKVGPYNELKEGITDVYEKMFRTGSLFVNSLCLTGFLVCYHTVLLINYHRTGKFSPLLVILSLFTLLLTGSRTSFVVVVVVWIMFVFYLNNGQRERSRTIGIMLLITVVLFLVLWILFKDYLILFFERFTERSEHRESSLQTTINILSANPFGVGYDALDDAFSSHASDGFVLAISTLDNTYLTFFATSGVFFFIPFLFYFFIPLNAFSCSRHSVNYRSVVMLFLPYILCGLTFNIEAFMQLNMVYFILAGHMYRIIQKETQYGLINNNSQLQYA